MKLNIVDTKVAESEALVTDYLNKLETITLVKWHKHAISERRAFVRTEPLLQKDLTVVFNLLKETFPKLQVRNRPVSQEGFMHDYFRHGEIEILWLHKRGEKIAKDLGIL